MCVVGMIVVASEASIASGNIYCMGLGNNLDKIGERHTRLRTSINTCLRGDNDKGREIPRCQI